MTSHGLELSSVFLTPAVLQELAEKALILLDWLNHPQQLTADAQDTLKDSNVPVAIPTKQELIRLLHRLLRPHLPNPKIIANTVFFLGIPALMAEWVVHEEQNPWLSELCTMLMLRAPGAARLLVIRIYAFTPEDHQQLIRCCTSIWWIFCDTLLLLASACSTSALLKLALMVGQWLLHCCLAYS